MRTLLPATAATLVLALSMAATAHAQVTGSLTPTPGPMHPSGVTPAPSGGPNTFEIHASGRLNWYAGIARSSVDNLAGTKTDAYDTQGYIRLYPGFTAETANGLQYGVATEVRMPGSTGGVAGINAGETSRGETPYWMRAYGFVATAELGTLRFGAGDSVMDLFQVGTFENFNDGAWNGDVENFFPQNAIPDFAFADIPAIYSNNRITYISPSFAGLQFGLDFAPNTANLWNDSGCGTGRAGQLGCNRLISQDLSVNYPRARNTGAAGIQYTSSFDDIGIDASITYMGSGTVANTSAGGIQYTGLSVGAGGLTVSYAGFTLGGHIAGGAMNHEFSLMPKGGRRSLSWMLGAEYEIGPFIAGASYFQTQEAGNWFRGGPVARTENDTGIAAGATYAVAPGFNLFLSYLYGTRHQAGWDFAEDEPGADANNVHAQVIALGTQLAW